MTKFALTETPFSMRSTALLRVGRPTIASTSKDPPTGKCDNLSATQYLLFPQSSSMLVQKTVRSGATRSWATPERWLLFIFVLSVVFLVLNFEATKDSVLNSTTHLKVITAVNTSYEAETGIVNNQRLRVDAENKVDNQLNHSDHEQKHHEPVDVLAVNGVDVITSRAANSWIPVVDKGEDTLVSTLPIADEAKEEVEESMAIINEEAVATVVPLSRGIVLPLHDEIGTFGTSLLLELRVLGVDLPVEIPHCGDLSDVYQQILHAQDDKVRIYDVCELAATREPIAWAGSEFKPIFCDNLEQCQTRFRSFEIKVLGVIFSQFDEVMLMDADTHYFVSPMALWELGKYQQTGTIFFHDRMGHDIWFLAEQRPGQPNVSVLHGYLSQFNVSSFQALATIPRNASTLLSSSNVPLPLHFQPSDFLLTSHSWNLRSGHQMDSSLVIWNKARQQRATAILASFVALNGQGRPPSYGDKELFWIACELAETQYAFSDFGIGSIGVDVREEGTVLCGDMMQFFPVLTPNGTSSGDAMPLYMNTDRILTFNPKELYRMKARNANFYPGSPESRNLTMYCPFDVDIEKLTQDEINGLLRRKNLNAVLSNEVQKAKDKEVAAQKAKADEVATHLSRGIVMPLYNQIGTFGTSLILELRTLGVDLPIEIPHCGDLGPLQQKIISQKDDNVRIYDVCEQAAHTSVEFDQVKAIFCESVEDCYNRFRTFEIKILSVVFSQFDEVMLMDADTHYFLNPMTLWSLDKYQTTGTLFFHDRIGHDIWYLAERVRGQQNVSILHEFISRYDPSSYKSLAIISRSPSALPNISPLPLHFQPSDFLLSSHAWNLRTGHQMDSSLLLWNKAKQQRATAILASFVAINGQGKPPSYGDKEFFWVACELAETQYAFGDFGIGSIGNDVKNEGTVLCGDMMQFYPVLSDGTSSPGEAVALYMNTDRILTFDPNELFRIKARDASFYPGSPESRNLTMYCPFDVEPVKLNQQEIDGLLLRKSLNTLLKKETDQEEQLQISAAMEVPAEVDFTQSRGIVIPLYDDTAILGTSLILELRALGVDLPIEIPHCGDLSAQEQQILRASDSRLQIYNVCELAAKEEGDTNASPPLPRFCENLQDCYSRFRAYEIKILSVIYSNFDEIMMMDADTHFFLSPMPIWDTQKYQTTGTFFFHDRVGHDDVFLSLRLANQPNITVIHEFMSKYDPSVYKTLSVIPRDISNLPNISPLPLHFQPSDFLLSSHSWNLRSGHQMDSSLVFWNKAKQPRATAILASFVAINGQGSPPSYGDKELFWVACELAETQYAFSDLGIGNVGWDVRAEGTVLCGDMMQLYPVLPPNTHTSDAAFFYMNSDHILSWSPTDLYRTKARPATFFPDLLITRELSIYCPYDIEMAKLTQEEIEGLLLRKKANDALTEIANELISAAELVAARDAIKPPSQNTALVPHATQYPPSSSRGIVLPLRDYNAKLAASLITHLRAVNVDLPIEVTYCDILSPEQQQLLQNQDDKVRIYNVCELAAQESTKSNGSLLTPHFCDSVDDCNRQLGDVYLKVLAVLFSQFDEVMIIEADTHFFQNPMQLWDLEPYQTTGTLFFHDRVSQNDMFLSKRLPDKPTTSVLHQYLSLVDVSAFRTLSTIQRSVSALSNISPLPLKFEPSDFLLSSHTWNLRAGHQLDSSLLLWNKAKQPRATAILASMVAINGLDKPPSYREKEFFWIACELAETQYAFSEFGIGSIGSEVKEKGTVLCGNMLQFFPVLQLEGDNSSDAQILFMKGNDIISWDPTKLYRTKSRSAHVYPGSFEERKLAMHCPFDVELVYLSDAETEGILKRQSLHAQLK